MVEGGANGEDYICYLLTNVVVYCINIYSEHRRGTRFVRADFSSKRDSFLEYFLIVSLEMLLSA